MDIFAHIYNYSVLMPYTRTCTWGHSREAWSLLNTDGLAIADE